MQSIGNSTPNRTNPPLCKFIIPFPHSAAFNIAIDVQKESGPKLVDWKKTLEAECFRKRIEAVKADVESMAAKFPIPGRGDF